MSTRGGVHEQKIHCPNVLSYQQVQIWIAVQTLLSETASASSTGKANRSTERQTGGEE